MAMASAILPVVTRTASPCFWIAAAQPSNQKASPICSSNSNNAPAQAARRSVNGCLFAALVAAACSSVGITGSAHARDRRNKKEIPFDDFLTTSNGVKFFDVLEGRGPVAENGKTVLVHFDCIFRGITAVSSRESKLLGGNRIISQPYEFVVGSVPGRERKRKYVENANGLFSAQAAPKPPPALYSAVEGMRKGGKVVYG
ncbi:hypothetical protein O6H91_04G144400 [Diphasiastrum complanatum]|uniref:Uncharacterized protein n=1 Tax=Diphasiastrum complanatum TaxID=34168 RepID=A0ACC2E2C4_DIPCM|nr:hypothetical protein O6H91_04G144400 [Diphasiastrum complanatum]